jgi:transposase
MDEKIVQEMLHELFSSLEALETQNSAVLKFLKDKGIASDEELAPYLEQAGNASGVRWLATRVRMDYLLASAMKTAETDAQREAKQEPPQPAEHSRPTKEAADKPEQKTTKEQPEAQKDTGGKKEAKKQDDKQVAASSEAHSDESEAAEKERNQESKKDGTANEPATEKAA